jgi:hypothetical protein
MKEDGGTGLRIISDRGATMMSTGRRYRAAGTSSCSEAVCVDKHSPGGSIGHLDSCGVGRGRGGWYARGVTRKGSLVTWSESKGRCHRMLVGRTWRMLASLLFL